MSWLRRFRGIAMWIGLVAASPLFAQSHPPVDEGVTVFRGEQVPADVRVSVFVSHLAKMAVDRPDLAAQWLERFGLEVEDFDLAFLTHLYGDFDEKQGARHQKELLELDNDSDRAELGFSYQLEKAFFIGSVLGEWLAYLGEQGINTDAFLLNFMRDDLYSVSMGFSDRVPSPKRFQMKTERFEEGFASAYKKSFRTFVLLAQEEDAK